MFNGEKRLFVLRFWPLIFCMGWVIFTIYAPDPWILNNQEWARVLAFIGAVGLLCMFIWPNKRFVRFFGTLAAIAYPLHRAISIGLDNDGVLSPSRRYVAVTFSMLVVFALMVLYPMLWWAAKHKDLNNE